MKAIFSDQELKRLKQFPNEIEIWIGSRVFREGVKEVLFSNGIQALGAYVLNEQEALLRLDPEIQVTSTYLRKKILETVLKNHTILQKIPRLRSMRGKLSRSKWVDRIDFALSQARLAFAHEDEYEVMDQMLKSKLRRPIRDSVRQEMKLVSFAYESMLQSYGLVDVPLLKKRVITKLDTLIKFDKFGFKKSIKPFIYLGSSRLDPLDQALYSVLNPERQILESAQASLKMADIEAFQAHSIDEAMEYLSDWAEGATILFPENPILRRSFRRVLEDRGLKPMDPRNPLFYRESEFLNQIGESLSISDHSKKNLIEFQEWIFAQIEKSEGPDALRLWSPSVEQWVEDYSLIEDSNKKIPHQKWVHEMKSFLRQATPPAPQEQYRGGITFVSLPQVSTIWSPSRLLVVGVGTDYLRPSVGDWWLDHQERECLSEMGVSNTEAIHQERTCSLGSWVQASQETRWLDWRYDFDGTEKASVTKCVSLPAHSRFLHHYIGPKVGGTSLPVLKSRQLALGSQISATELDTYSRCGYLGLIRHVWRLSDPEDAQYELGGLDRGRILHRSIECMLRDNLKPLQAIEKAWEENIAQSGTERWIQTERGKAWVFRQGVQILEAFLVEEESYRAQSGARVMGLERDNELSLEMEGVRVRGFADRIDERDSELLIMDYKTSSQLPTGKEIFQKGTYLQLAFYALAAAKKYEMSVAGALFVELSKKASRTKGILDGEKIGRWFKTHPRNQSVLGNQSGEIWDILQAHIEKTVSSRKGGAFPASPKNEAYCYNCLGQHLCGKARSRVF